MSLPATHSHIPPVLVSRAAAAVALGLSERSVDYLIADGRLKAKRIGGRIMLSYRTLLAFAESGDTGQIKAA